MSMWSKNLSNEQKPVGHLKPEQYCSICLMFVNNTKPELAKNIDESRMIARWCNLGKRDQAVHNISTSCHCQKLTNPMLTTPGNKVTAAGQNGS